MRTATVFWTLLAVCLSCRIEAAEAPDFNADVLPVFRKYCLGCHNSRDAEGGLILQDYAQTMKGGDEGRVVTAGKSSESRLWKMLAATDETQMPPKGKPAPDDLERALLRAWIDAGAHPPKGSTSAAGLVTPRIPLAGPVRNTITAVATSNDGKWTAVATPQSVQVTGERTLELTGHTGKINDVTFSLDNRWLCVAAGEIGLSGEITLWNTSDWTRGPVLTGHRDAVYSAQISPDGKFVASASYDRDILLWEIPSGRISKTLRGHNDAVFSISFSPNGKLLASASGDRTVKLWDVQTGQRLDTFSQPSKEQTTVAFSPDGKLLAAGGVDSRVRIWQISESGSEGTNPILYARFAHEGPILKLAFSSNGKLLASAAEDRRIKLWETKSFTQVAQLERQAEWVGTMSFTADNLRLIVGRVNGEQQSYSIDPAWADHVSDLHPLAESPELSASISFSSPGAMEEAEPNNAPANAQQLAAPATVRGKLQSPSDVDHYRLTLRAGESVVLETNASRSQSPADTRIEVLHPDGTPVLRALLQAVRDSWINFRPIDSSSPDVRLEFWEEMDLNQLVYLNGEVCKTFRAPQGPDSGFLLYSIEGRRRNYFDTSAAAHAKDEPAYIVEAFAPGSSIVDNGLPVFPLYYRNDDDSDRKWGSDSRLTFTAPADCDYLIKVTDTRGFGGDSYSYALTVRRPRPSFSVTINTMNPKVPAGSGQRLKFTLNRIDGFDGAVRLDLAGLPPGFESSSPVVIEAGQLEAFSTLNAGPDAVEPTQSDWGRFTILATAVIQGELVTKSVGGLGEIKLDKAPPIRVRLVADDPRFTSSDNGLVIEPGTTISAKIIVTRQGHDDDVRFDVDNLPHGIIVDNIGLSGVLVRKNETERQIFLTARPWVPETDVWIHAMSQGVGNQTTPAIRLHVRRDQPIANR